MLERCKRENDVIKALKCKVDISPNKVYNTYR